CILSRLFLFRALYVYCHMDLSPLLAFIPLAFTALFPVVNPIGTSILFLNLTDAIDSKSRRKLARKVAANSIVVMLFTLFIGVYVLKLFGISIPVVQLCGGMILFTMGWKSLNSNEDANDASKREFVKDDVSNTAENLAFYPFTLPLTIGPGTIATTLTLSAEAAKGERHHAIEGYIGAGIAMVLISFIIFLSYGYAD